MKPETSVFGKATFAIDRGYDDNKILLILDALCHDYVIDTLEEYTHIKMQFAKNQQFFLAPSFTSLYCIIINLILSNKGLKSSKFIFP